MNRCTDDDRQTHRQTGRQADRDGVQTKRWTDWQSDRQTDIHLVIFLQRSDRFIKARKIQHTIGLSVTQNVQQYKTFHQKPSVITSNITALAGIITPISSHLARLQPAEERHFLVYSHIAFCIRPPHISSWVDHATRRYRLSLLMETTWNHYLPGSS